MYFKMFIVEMFWVIGGDFISQLLYFIPTGMTLRLFEKSESGRGIGGNAGVASFCRWRLKGLPAFFAG